MNIYYSKFIDFFKRHNLYDKNIFDYLRLNSIMFDYYDDDNRDFIGCFWKNENGILRKISLGVPFIDSDITVLINIHEYIHGIMLYEKLGKRFNPGLDIEILPMLYEKIYISENPSDELIKYGKMLDERIEEEGEIQYILAIKYRNKLIEMYHNGMSFNKLDKCVKRLVKKDNKDIR